MNNAQISLDENYNLQTNGDKESKDDMLPKEDQTLNKDDVKTTGSPKHKELAIDPYPRRYSLEELIEDMSPSNDPGKEPAFQAII